MARPRIFISSTFYDLKQIRSDIERSIRELGYEPVRHETGAVAYANTEALESAAYREIELCDIIVFVMGGRYGTESEEDPGYSISQVELKRALEKGIQVFIFVEGAVLHEYATYKLNAKTDNVKYSSVDDIKVFRFLDGLYSLPKNNAIAQFEVAADITAFLKEQFAGLFHRFLQEEKRLKELSVLDEMNSVAKTLRELVGYLTEERRNSDEAIKSILLSNHPAFRRLAEVTGTKYRVFFSTRKEMNVWLEARNWQMVENTDSLDVDSVEEWAGAGQQHGHYLKFTEEIFDEDDKLKPYTADEWDDDWIQRVKPELTEDDIPF